MIINKLQEGWCGIMNNELSLAELPQFILNWVDHNSQNIIGVWDSEMKLIFVTKSVLTILGYDPIELLGDNWKNVFSEEDQTYLYQSLTTPQKSSCHQFFITDYLDNPLPFECKIDKVFDVENNKFYLIGVLNPIPDQRKTEEMIVKSEKMSIAGQLAAGIAHEIRNPLTSLKGFLQLLQAGVNQKEIYYQIMIEEIEKIEMITSELLFISKPLTDEKKIESVYSMIKDVIMLLESQAHLKNIEIKCSVDKDLYTYCDRSQIKQVLINIIKNAIEATDKVGIIKIEVQSTIQGDIEIDIIDEGPGISKDIIDKVGEPFFTTKKSGTGLGLMITKQILEQQDGKIFIVKSNETGSTFRIVLPVATGTVSSL